MLPLLPLQGSTMLMIDTLVVILPLSGIQRLLLSIVVILHALRRRLQLLRHGLAGVALHDIRRLVELHWSLLMAIAGNNHPARVGRVHTLLIGPEVLLLLLLLVLAHHVRAVRVAELAHAMVHRRSHTYPRVVLNDLLLYIWRAELTPKHGCLLRLLWLVNSHLVVHVA